MPVVSDYTSLLYTRIWSGNTERSIASWNLHEDVGNPIFVTYSFASETTLPDPGASGVRASSVYTLTEAEKDAIRDAIQHLSGKAGVTFVETAGVGMIHMAGAELSGNTAGRAGLPNVTEYNASNLNLVLDTDLVSPTTDAGLEVALHEIMHSLGLEHPHEGFYTLDPSLDSDATTLMSYEESGTDFTTIRPMDTAALRNLYGKKDAKKNWDYGFQDDGSFKIKGAFRDDWITGITGENRLLGVGGDDHLTGRHSDDVLDGGKGNDTLVASRGDDLARGGAGNDEIHGDGEHIELNGANETVGGNDTLKGGAGKDTIRGGGGDDSIEGGGARDKLFGDYGADTLKGGAGNDTLDGGIWQDQLFGGSGNDVLKGGDNFDSLYGGNGNDSLTDSGGSDLLDGGAGRDTLKGGEGSDTLTGGSGKDRFVFSDASKGSFKYITDFEIGLDRVSLPGAAPDASTVTFFDNASVNGIVGTLVQTDGSTGFRLLFQGLSAAEVSAAWDDFTF